MASKTTLNAINLESLGAKRLAVLLMEISSGDATAKRRLRMELAGQDSPEKLIVEIKKRLTAIGSAESFIGWRSLKAFRTDLQSQRQLIWEKITPSAPTDAVALLRQFLSMSNGVLERSNDSSGQVYALFQQATADLARAVLASNIPRAELIDDLAHLVILNGYGQIDGLIGAVAAALTPDDMHALRTRILAVAARPEPARTEAARRRSKWGRRRTLEYSSVRRRSRAETVRMSIESIADALGDVDAFIALQPSRPTTATRLRIADRQLRAGRAEAALNTLDAITDTTQAGSREWVDLRLAVLEANDKFDVAQALRLETFHTTLDTGYLRSYLKRLPDFDDVEAEDEALDRVLVHPDANRALAVFIAWPSLDRAARLVVSRLQELGGDSDLMGAADRLAGRYPLASILLLRHVVEAILFHARSDQYKVGVAAIWEIDRLSGPLSDFAGLYEHSLWSESLRQRYRHRFEFWQAVDR